MAGRIIVDMTFLRTEALIEPEGLPERKYYRVQFTLAMIVDRGNLRYEARWPFGEDARVQERGHTSIAATFVPGTK